MTVSLSWLNDYLTTDLTPEQLAEALTSIGLEVEKIEQRDSIMGGLAGIIAGKVLTCKKHPDADKLSLTTVDVGKDQPASIVCGANNIAAGQMVWVALPETTLYDSSGKPWTIKAAKIRGTVSEGMICAEDELGLGEDHEGIMVLPDAVHVGTKASDYYKVTSDTIFEIGLTPNRSDATSIIGVAEDLAAYFSVQSGSKHLVKWPVIPELKIKSPVAELSTGMSQDVEVSGDLGAEKATNNNKSPIGDLGAEKSKSFKVTVNNHEACPRYSGVLISNIAIGPAPEWIQKRLQSIDVRTINNIVDITNFVLHEMGQPLHAFDADKITNDEIIVEAKPTGGAFIALDGQTYNLFHDDLMICDGLGNPMCIGGVYGGLNSGVTDGTKTIFLESAHFDAKWIRRTSMRHNLRTEAARRFEKGSDPNLTLKALARACDLISQYAGGVVASQVFDIYPKPISPARVELNYANLNAITGISFNASDIFRILDALNMEVVEKQDHKIVVAVPTNKADVLREIDVIEEILRIYGFSNIPFPGKMYTTVAIEPRHVSHRIRRLLGGFLASRGFLEAMNMSLTQPGYYKGLELTDREQWVTIHNTSNESQNLLRPEMIVPMLETVKRNINRKQDNIRLFEFGRSYHQEDGKPFETEHLLVVISGDHHPDHWQTGNAKPVDFFTLKAEVNALLHRAGIRDFHSKNIEKADNFAYGVEYKSGASVILRFGAVSSKWLDTFDISQEVFVADFDFVTLAQLSSQSQTYYEELNRFPSVERDLAIVIDQSKPFHEISEVVWKAGGAWLTDLEVFDIYANPEHLGPGKKSMALRFTIENKEATLTDRDIDQWFSKMQKALVAELKAEVRK